MKIMFTGGGTLGHVMPSLYLMDDLKGCEFFYIGTNGIEKNAVEKKVKKYYTIPATKLIRGKIFSNFKIPFVLIKSIHTAKKILKEVRPDIIFSKGGYVSLPVCVASKMLHIPVITHESDSSFGLANRLILRVCDKMCVNFKNLEGKNKKIIYTGPIFSKSFDDTARHIENYNLDKNKHTILFVGGSLGSKVINQNLYPILKDLEKDFNIIHITGKGNCDHKSFGNYISMETSNDMVNLYNIADFVVGRSGAGVSAECCYKRVPMLLIPLENKRSRGDQVKNAEYYKNLGVAKILREPELNPNKLLTEIKNLDKNLDKYKSNYDKIKPINGRISVINLIKQYKK